jgi:solute carrier family 25 protein 16
MPLDQKQDSNPLLPPTSSLITSSPTVLRELLAGGIAGAAGKSSVAPLERIKILYQTGKLHTSGSVTATFKDILSNEGLPGLFRGNGASVLRIIPYASIHFGLYEYNRRNIIKLFNIEHDDANIHSVPPFIDLLAGSSAGATAVAITYPLDLVRTRLAYATETNNASHSNSSRHTIRRVLTSTYRSEGLRGMYRGIGPSMYGILPYAGIKFYVYQHLKQFYIHKYGPDTSNSNSGGNNKMRLPTTVMLGCGAVAGLAAQTATYPFDVVRRRMQIDGLLRTVRMGTGSGKAPLSSSSSSGWLPRSTPGALIEIAKREGWRRLYAGLRINYMKVVPSTAIGFTIYDHMKYVLELPQNL